MQARALPQLAASEIPLERVNLIEASAGTGKTRTISDLYVRLVVEEGLAVDRVLVVTYTKAATAELRQRIRGRLEEVLADFQRGESCDALARVLLERCPDRAQTVKRMRYALGGFDEAAIFTVHGFCQRVLSDHAFESGMPFEMEVVSNEHDILQEVVEDFWRKELYEASMPFVNHVLVRGQNPERLAEAIRRHVGKPFLKVIGPQIDQDSGMDSAFAHAFRETRELWYAYRAEVEDLLLEHPGLNRTRYARGSIPRWMTAMDEYFDSVAPNPSMFSNAEKFTDKSLARSVKKGHRPPQHPFFAACGELYVSGEALRRIYDRRMWRLKEKLLSYCNEELENRKQRRRVCSYNDLLNNVVRPLSGPRGDVLARKIRDQFSAALIDEFQDTDPVQYDIFRRIYVGTRLPLFLVGDPKQAIYGFRGADVFAFLKGRSDADYRYTLDLNWRSDPDLVRAVNTIFGSTPCPFVLPEIPFTPSTSANKEREVLTIAGKREPVFHLWFVSTDGNSNRLNKGVAYRRAEEATAAEIAHLLDLGAQGKARIGDRSIAGGDIAVLVRTNAQGVSIHDALSRLGVVSVQHTQDSVFESRDAVEVEWVLRAVAEPARDAFVRAAVSTEMLGVSGADLHGFLEHGQSWDEILERFHAYHALWKERGFMRMFRELLLKEGVAARLLSLRYGERRLTNVLHLGELLQGEGVRKPSGMEGLIQWFSERRHRRGLEDDEEQLRLESDQHLVQIVTVHKSKGLEYPVVFCPFLWGGQRGPGADEPFTFHDPDDNYKAVLDMGSEERDKGLAQVQHEDLAESIRLLYVALTRAKHRCYMVWGAIKGMETSPAAWVLHASGSPEPCDLDTVVQYVSKLSDSAMLADLDRLAERSDGAIGVTPLATGEHKRLERSQPSEVKLAARKFSGSLRTKRHVTSFSALTTGDAPESPDYDARALALEYEKLGSLEPSIFSFPRGAHAGTCWHALFERLDFGEESRAATEALVERTLLEYGFNESWIVTVADMVDRVMNAWLDTARTIRLKDLSWKRRLNELEFYYPVKGLNPASLRHLFKEHGFGAGPSPGRAIDNLSFSPVRGFMKGYIDLVFETNERFYLLDYKSNWLGPVITSYDESQLSAVMVRESYYLQYLIYTVAVHRYLRGRLPFYNYDTHFGGVFYVFLRGIDPTLGPDFGIFRDRPSSDLVEAMDRYLQTG